MTAAAAAVGVVALVGCRSSSTPELFQESEAICAEAAKRAHAGEPMGAMAGPQQVNGRTVRLCIVRDPASGKARVMIVDEETGAVSFESDPTDSTDSS